MVDVWFAGVGPNSVYIYKQTKTQCRAMDLMLNCGRRQRQPDRYDWGPYGKNRTILARDMLAKALGSDLATDDLVELFSEQVIALLPPLLWIVTYEQICDWWIAGIKIVPQTLPGLPAEAVPT